MVNSLKTLFFICLFITTFIFGAFYENQSSKNLLENDNFILKKEFYECYLGITTNDPEQPKVCVVYRAKGLDLSAYPNNRHRDNNKEQRKSIRSNEQIVRNILEN